MIEPKVVHLESKKLIGITVRTSLSEFNPASVWQRLMPRVKEIENKTGSEKYSIQVYNKPFNYGEFNPNMKFNYWAAIEVDSLEEIPDEMDFLEIPGGNYAVFLHKGDMGVFQKTLRYIYTQWLPSSEFEIDHRPHFEKLDERYLGLQNPESQEEIWIPISYL